MTRQILVYNLRTPALGIMCRNTTTDYRHTETGDLFFHSLRVMKRRKREKISRPDYLSLLCTLYFAATILPFSDGVAICCMWPWTGVGRRPAVLRLLLLRTILSRLSNPSDAETLNSCVATTVDEGMLCCAPACSLLGPPMWKARKNVMPWWVS